MPEAQVQPVAVSIRLAIARLLILGHLGFVNVHQYINIPARVLDMLVVLAQLAAASIALVNVLVTIPGTVAAANTLVHQVINILVPVRDMPEVLALLAAVNIHLANVPAIMFGKMVNVWNRLV